MPSQATPQAAPSEAAPAARPLKFAGSRWLLLIIVFVAIMALAMTVGLPIPFSDLWSRDTDRATTAHLILWQLRLPRVLAGALVGASLATSGAALQAVFRNPLAEPYLLGISAGGALGAALAEALHLPSWHSFDATIALAFVGALSTTWVIYRLGQGRISALLDGQGGFDRATLLLTGVAISSFLASLMGLVVTLSDRIGLAQQMTFWLLGGLTRATITLDVIIGFTLVVGVAIMLSNARDLDALLVGDEEAATLGVAIGALHRRLLCAAALMSAAAVATAGLIGFVGLLAPHLIRRLFSNDARTLVPAAALGGAALLMGCDAIAHTAAGAVEIPVGIVTALLGVPLFLFLLRKT